MPEPTWNDPDWPKTLSGWLIIAFTFAAFVFTLVMLAYLIGESFD